MTSSDGVRINLYKSAKLKDIMKTFTKYFGDSIVIQK